MLCILRIQGVGSRAILGAEASDKKFHTDRFALGGLGALFLVPIEGS